MEGNGANHSNGEPQDSALRLAILSRGPRLYSTRRLVEEARKRGLDPYVADPMKFSLFVADGRIDILHNGEPFNYDAVIPRIGHSITKHGVAVLRHLEQLGIWTANTGAGILQSRDKLHASQILARNRIPVPRTTYVRDIIDVETAVDFVGGLPVVIKVTQGTQGQGGQVEGRVCQVEGRVCSRRIRRRARVRERALPGRAQAGLGAQLPRADPALRREAQPRRERARTEA